MAYFANGSEGEFYREKFCNNCVHDDDQDCVVWCLHLIWNYDAVGKDKDETKETALNTLWPRDGAHNGTCAMFHQKEVSNA